MINQAQQFCDYIQHQKRYSHHTVVAYKNDLEQFVQYAHLAFAVNEWSEINTSIIRSWIVALIEEGNTSTTINRKISSLKSFYKYMMKNGLVATNPLLKVVVPKTSKRLPVFVNENEINQLFSNIEFEDTFEGQRDKLIMELFYLTGIRLTELINLKISDVNTYNLTIKVLGKRNKERVIPITSEFIKLFQSYLVYRDEIPADSNYVFLTERGKKIYEKLVYRIVNNYLSLVTTADKKSPHVIRHTFATHMLNRGAELNTIKEILGHASLSATQVYTHNTIEKLKTIYKQAHPRA